MSASAAGPIQRIPRGRRIRSGSAPGISGWRWSGSGPRSAGPAGIRGSPRHAGGPRSQRPSASSILPTATTSSRAMTRAPACSSSSGSRRSCAGRWGVRTDSPLWRSARRASGTRTFSHAVGILERAARPLPGVLNVLTYHRVDEPEDAPELYPGLNGATPDEFEEHMRFLASSCRTLSLSELLAVRRGEAPLPSHAVLVTFDDGYRSVAEHAWPIMQRHGVPLTLFVPTAYPGRPGNAFWWDRLWSALEGKHATPDERLRTYRRLRERVKSLPHEQAMAYVDELGGGAGAESGRPSVLDWHELRRLAAEGVALGPHSRTHPLLDKVARANANEEILGSLGDLEREVGPVPRVFAYPGGAGEGMT